MERFQMELDADQSLVLRSTSWSVDLLQKKHGLLLSLALHLLPGVFTGAVFFLLRPKVMLAGSQPATPTRCGSSAGRSTE